MYAIIEVGAKQYLVKKGDTITVEKQASQIGKDITFDKVLLVSKEKKIEIGEPYLKEAKVQATVLGDIKDKKIVSFKYRRRKSSRWTKGHRQQLTQLKIKEIELGEK
jgi:large subunit ribosomal protein L21